MQDLGHLLKWAEATCWTGEVQLHDWAGNCSTLALRAGRPVRAEVAGVFDPLLVRLERAGFIDDGGLTRALQALASSESRSGDLAQSLFDLPPGAVRSVVAQQLSERIATLVARSAQSPHRFALHPASPSDVATPTQPRAERRRALRKLARRLHPDRHGHLPEAERAALADQLARATAAYHGL